MKNRAKAMVLILECLIAALCVFIFSNSLATAELSDAQSGWVAALLRPILDPCGRMDPDVFHGLVRKLAHVTEFGLLGVLSGLVAGTVARSTKAALRAKWAWPVCSIRCVLVALCDEGIQTMVPGRSGSLTDVGIDCLGAACGLFFAFIFTKIMIRYRERRTWQN